MQSAKGRTKSKSVCRTPAKKRSKAKSAKTRLKISDFEKMVVQRYLEKPTLYQGQKFEIRAFMIILCSKPFLVLANPGYARVSLSKFTMANFGKKQV